MQKTFNIKKLPLAALIGAMVASSIAGAQPGPATEEIVVFGRGTDLVGQANAASEGSVSGADLLLRPMFKTAELLESMPGMVAVQHSGSGKANQYFLRGFNLDHGTDYTAILDGMPLNMRSHGHGQGYLDVNGLIPETVERIDYRKGPYRADLGDFAMVGASFIRTIDSLDRSFISGEAGENSWQRYVGGTSVDASGGTFTVIGELKQYDGPWGSPEDLDHKAIWAKYLTDTSFGRASVTLSGYDATWNPTEQVPERGIGTAACPDAFCSLDPTADGSTERWILTSQLEGSDWDANVYAQTYDWTMKSNPTYDFQLGQFDKRWTVGGSANKLLIDNSDLEFRTGVNFRYDDAESVGVSHFDQGEFVEENANNEIAEGSIGAYAETTWHATDDLRVMGGLRGDYYDFDVTAFNANSAEGNDTDSQISPKIALAYTLTDSLELYTSWGKGFHSNDARGVVNATDPLPGLSPGTGYEVGARTTIGDFKFTAAYWWLDQDSELIFVGDSNAVEPKGGSERDGVELTAFWQPLSWLGIDAVYTHNDARYIDNPEGFYVENALEEAAQIGISASKDNWDISLRARYLGPYALLADNSQRADPLTTVNLRGAYNWESLTVFAEVINMLDSEDKEIVYFYEAVVPGLDPPSLSSEDIDCSETNCRLSRQTAPRMLRMGVSYKF